MSNRADNGMLASEATAAAGNAAPDRYARLVALQNDNVVALARLHAIFRDGAVEWSNDLLEFAAFHFQRPSNEAGWRINSGAPLEATASHLRYCHSFAEQCLQQTARFLNLAAKISRDSRLHLESHAATVLGHLERDERPFALRESSAQQDRARPEAGKRQQ